MKHSIKYCPSFLPNIPSHQQNNNQPLILLTTNTKSSKKLTNRTIITTSHQQAKSQSSCLTLGKFSTVPVHLCCLEALADTTLTIRRKDFSDKAEEKLTPDSQKSLFDKTKEGVTDAGK